MSLSLYVGSDEANHGCKKSKEIIVSAFSLYEEDGRVVHISPKRDFEMAKEYLSIPGRDWLFTLNGILARESLTQEVPGLIDYWIRKNDLTGKISNIESAFDGNLLPDEQRRFVRKMRNEIGFNGKINVRFHAKRDGASKSEGKFYDSELVWAADSLASNLFQDLRDKKEIITLPQYMLLDD